MGALRSAGVDSRAGLAAAWRRDPSWLRRELGAWVRQPIERSCANCCTAATCRFCEGMQTDSVGLRASVNGQAPELAITLFWGLCMYCARLHCGAG